MSLTNFIRLAALACALAVAVGCSAGGIPTDRPASSAVGQPNVPGQPRKTDAGNVPTAPISIPSTNAWQNDPIDTVRQRVEKLIRGQCGNGELCVNVAVARGDDDSYDQCHYAGSNPDTSEPIVLPRGSTITLLTGTWECDTSTDETTESASGSQEPEPNPKPTTTDQTTTDVHPTG